MARETLDIAQLKHDDISFLKLGKKVYTITPVSCDIEQVFAEMKAHLGERVTRFMADTNEALYTAATEEGRKEVEHIRRIMQRGDIAVPSTQFNKPIVVLNDGIYAMKSVVHNPCIARGTYQAWCGRVGQARTNEVFANLPGFPAIRDGNNDIRITARLECHMSHPAVTKRQVVVHIVKVNNNIYTSGQSFHSTGSAFNDAWRRQCTGQMTAAQYYTLPNLSEVFNSINFDSIGSSVASFVDYTCSTGEYMQDAIVDPVSRVVIMPDAWRTG